MDEMAISARSLRQRCRAVDRIVKPLQEVMDMQRQGKKDLLMNPVVVGDHPEPISDLVWDGPEEHSLTDLGRVKTSWTTNTALAPWPMPGAVGHRVTKSTTGSTRGQGNFGSQDSPTQSSGQSPCPVNPFAPVPVSVPSSGSLVPVSVPSSGSLPAANPFLSPDVPTAGTASPISSTNPFVFSSVEGVGGEVLGNSTSRERRSSLTSLESNPFALGSSLERPPPPLLARKEGKGKGVGIGLEASQMGSGDIVSKPEAWEGWDEDLGMGERDGREAEGGDRGGGQDHDNVFQVHGSVPTDDNSDDPNLVGTGDDDNGTNDLTMLPPHEDLQVPMPPPAPAPAPAFSFDGSIFRDPFRLCKPSLGRRIYRFVRQRWEVAVRAPGGLRLRPISRSSSVDGDGQEGG
ncbi:unnamed protein product, partial [Choristocarpus tenellus]